MRDKKKRRGLFFRVHFFYPGHDAFDACANGCAVGAMARNAGAKLPPRDDMCSTCVRELGIKSFWMYMDAPEVNKQYGG